MLHRPDRQYETAWYLFEATARRRADRVYRGAFRPGGQEQADGHCTLPVPMPIAGEKNEDAKTPCLALPTRGDGCGWGPQSTTRFAIPFWSEISVLAPRRRCFPRAGLSVAACFRYGACHEAQQT